MHNEVFSIPYAEKYISHAKYFYGDHDDDGITRPYTKKTGLWRPFFFCFHLHICMVSYLDSHGMSTCSMYSPINDAKLTRPQNFIGENLVGFRNVFFILFRFWLFRSSTKVKNELKKIQFVKCENSSN